jgi:4-alpha-glucanotransferase
VPPGAGRATVHVIVREEAGHEWRMTGRAGAGRSVTLRIPTRLPYGYHRVHVAISAGARSHEAQQSLIVVPSRCTLPGELLGNDRVYGVVANLYAMRREKDWGIGDFTTLAGIVDWAAARDAQFVGVNPLHALFNRGRDISPYSPVSRLFRNHIYIDVEAVPWARESDEGRQLLASVQRERERLRSARQVDYDGVIALKERVLREAHRAFLARAREGERRAYDEFVRTREPELTRFATWMTLAEDARSSDWRSWPQAMHDPGSAAVAAFREAHAERVDFHRWLQFETHRQLGECAARARAGGMRIGVYQDLAIGTNAGGSDTWSYPDLFLAGASVGAPPDPYSAVGQNWGLPPMNPRALREQGYRYWVQLLRRAFEHAGALRIDHVMGLFRGFWIPDGASGVDGAYVRYPAADMLGILALESVRHNAIVVGEDLGTVPPEVPPALKRWGVLSSRVLYFEKTRRGYTPASRYPELALATANTHDMATLAGFWHSRDVELRRQVGLLAPGKPYRDALRERERDKGALLERLDLDWPRSFELETFPRRLTGAVHDFLCSSRARLVGVALDDVLGETEPVNVPGVGPDRYPSWRRRSRMTLEEAAWSFEVDDAIRCHRRRPGGV